MNSTKVKLAGICSYAPEKVLTNEDLEEIVDTSDEWIRARTGMKERRISDKDTPSSELAYGAISKLFDQVDIKKKEIDLIIVATVTPDNPFPSTAAILQHKLGLNTIPAFDISAGCTGFIYAISIAKQFIENGNSNNAIVVGVEELTKITNWDDRSTCVLFGDGAGAALLTKAKGGEISEIIDTYISADGKYGDLLIQKAGGSKMPASHKTVDENLHTVYMEGNKIFKSAVKAMGHAAVKILKDNGLTGEDVDWLIPHQANMRIIASTAKRAKIKPNKVITNIEKFGNTSSASIPLAFAEAVEEGQIKRGDVIVLDAFGAGLTWGSVLLRY
ncbi:MAG: ketoacyl-ACP synthase III [Candidatus Cloacimonetes bacterium]|nr:ketoacyl-ACP synthase III [Candidatus Cloacimonadota bacterium]MBS3766524.1 ketoacyl-ACP synthase III [Candidatus Cloacimonadota bacterium]